MASNFFNKASLVMVPDAPIDGKLPSVKPEDRSGDFTFSRGSNLAATRVNKGGLIEKGRENLLLQSNQFDTTWAEAGSSDIITSGFTGYDGSTDAWQLEHKGSQFTSLRQTLSSSGVQTYSLYAKAGTLDYVVVYAQSSVSPKAWFNLSNGTIGTQQGSTIDASIESVGNGWYRCSIVFNDTLVGVRIYPNDGDGTYGTTSGSIYIQDAQLEQGLVATDYIETTTATVQKGILENLPRLDYSGGASCPSLLLEPQRTNRILFSEWFGAWDSFSTFLTYKDGISPSGYKDATKLYIPADNANVYIRTQFSNVANQTHIGSIFLKKVDGDEVRLRLSGSTPNIEASAIFNLSNGTYRDAVGSVTPSIENYGNGWYRCSVGDLGGATVATPSLRIDALGTGYAPTVYVWGAQVEVGSYPTSYIPTYSSSVTRSADDTLLNDLYTNHLITASGGTWFLEIKNNIPLGRDTISNFFIADTSNSANNAFVFRGNLSPTRLSLNKRVSGSLSLLYQTTQDDLKIAIKWNGTSVDVFENGAKVVSASPFTATALNFFRGNAIDITKQIHQTLLFPTALTDDECIALTTI